MWATTSFCSGNSSAIGFAVGTRRMKLSTAVIFMRILSLALELHVLVGRGERIRADRAEPRFRDPGADAVEERQLVDRREHHALVHELLHAMEDGLTLRPVELAGLLAEEPVEIRIPAVGEH